MLSWRRTALTLAAVGSAATYSLIDELPANLAWLAPVVLATAVVVTFILATMRGANLMRGHTPGCHPLARATSTSICLIAGALILVIVAQQLWHQ